MDFSQPKHPNKKFIAIFYDKCQTLIDDFTDEEVGQLIKAAIAYDIGGESPDFSDRAMRVHFAAIKKDIDLTTQKADKLSVANRNNVNKRWQEKNSEKKRWQDKSSDEMTLEEMDADIDMRFPRTHSNK